MTRLRLPGRRAQAVLDAPLAAWTVLLLGVSIALIPSLPVLVLYVAPRFAGARERRARERASAGGVDPWLQEVLARRARVHLPYHRLRRVGEDPLEDLRRGRHARLADAELQWFGVPPPRRTGHR